MWYHIDSIGKMQVPDEYFSRTSLHIATCKNDLTQMEAILAKKSETIKHSVTPHASGRK